MKGQYLGVGESKRVQHGTSEDQEQNQGARSDSAVTSNLTDGDLRKKEVCGEEDEGWGQRTKLII